MMEDARESETPKEDLKGEAHDIESQIKCAMSARTSYFKEKSDSITFEGVRRLIEEDLGLVKYALDGQKTFIKQCLFECINGSNDNSTKSGEIGGTKVSLQEDKESDKSHETLSSNKDVKDPISNDEDEMEDSPVMGLLAEHRVVKSEAKETGGRDGKEDLSENTIKKAMSKRVPYIKANLEKITLAELRRLLEKDIGVDKHALDPYKNFISRELDQILEMCEASEPSSKAKKKNVKKIAQGKKSKKISSEETSDSSDSENEKAEDEVDHKKKRSSKGKVVSSEGTRKRGRPAKETKVSGKRRIKRSEIISEDKSDAEDSEHSENDCSESANEKPVKKKEIATPAYGKRVEHLKSTIKSCGMSVPPSVYKRVKQVPENKREACLIKELEDILAKEGLSSNPSEKEIKEVKKRKQRAKELEGIDTSNIVTSSRRRSTASFVAPTNPKIPVESDSNDTDDGDEDDDNDDAGGEEQGEEGEGDGDGDSESEESSEDNDEDSSD